MNSRTHAITLAIVGLLLAVSFDPVNQLESPGAWFVWLAIALTILVVAFIYAARNAIAAFRRRSLFQLDMMFSTTFIALPFCGTLILVVIWNMAEVVAGR